jgi:COP9 signalosome complex subunit 1|mmetsp:Transcript_50341/g.79758  ORF Transcript_50341/g.79758 Transcript_50341/m.79758 type:complete len:425 (-) Transcript_50341:94-1368(-)
MAATILIDDLETYIGQYGTHGAIQRLQFIAQKTDRKYLQIDANRICLDLLKRTTNTKAYSEVHNVLRELVEGTDTSLPQFDTVWVEATQKQASILKDVYEQDLHQSKVTQVKETIRTCHNQLANFFTEHGDYATALKYVSKSREYCSDPSSVLLSCMTIIKLSALLRQYSDIQSFTSKARHSHFSDEADQSKIHAAYGLYYMTAGKYKEAAFSFAQVKQQDLTSTTTSSNNFHDILCAQDVALYGVLCALASLDRNEVQSKLLDSSFRECLQLVPQIQDLTLDFCSCKYAACLSTLEKLKEGLSLDVHLSSQVNDVCQQIRSKGMVQYFAPFLSVSLHSMATAFNTDVDGIQSEVASLITKKQLDAKIDSRKKVLHLRHANQRMQTYQNAMRVSQDFLESTQALILRMNLLKHDFGVHLVRQKK